mmetsp:Transcript_70465/g.196097  ORF Transcript_70465/g.196097 Transcript_70465/m.196097 type:complete len:242 (+) Transcript_70465:483-1208(+)
MICSGASVSCKSMFRVASWSKRQRTLCNDCKIMSLSPCFDVNRIGRRMGTFESASSEFVSGSAAKVPATMTASKRTSSSALPRDKSRCRRSSKPNSQSATQGTTGSKQSRPARTPSASTSSWDSPEEATASRTMSCSHCAPPGSPCMTVSKRDRSPAWYAACLTTFKRSASFSRMARSTRRGKCSEPSIILTHASSAAKLIHRATASVSIRGASAHLSASTMHAGCLLASVALKDASVDIW